MATTTRDPIRDVFGKQALCDLKASELRDGLEQLRQLEGGISATISSIRQQAKADMIAGKANASDALLNPGAAMDQAQRYLLTVQTAIEATEEAAEQAERNEEDAKQRARHAALDAQLEHYRNAGDNVEKAIKALAKAFSNLDAAGLGIMRAAGFKMGSDLAMQLRVEHVQHLINLGLHSHSDGLWGYDRVPPTRGYIPVSQNCNGIAFDLLNQFEERTEKAVGRAIEWVSATEAAAA